MEKIHAVAGLGLAGVLCLVLGCVSTGTGGNGGFADDVSFMKKHKPIILLKEGDAA